MFIGGAVHVHTGGGPAVVAHLEIAVGEAVTHRGDVAQTDGRAVRTSQDDDVLEVVLVVVLSQRADEDLLFAGRYPAGR